MKLLLDTCALLWLRNAPRRFGAAASAALQNPATELYASHASLWEIVLKHRTRKLKLPKPPREYWASLLETWDLAELAITPDALFQVGALPMHHRDPFDHLLIAQAQVHGLLIATSDPHFREYDVPLIW